MTGKWYADYVDLSTCAIGVKNRDATWSLPARRGENAVVPSRDGSIFVADKPFEEGEFALEMFAAGADVDGTVPADGDRRTAVRRNLDTLTKLFGSGRLIRLAYIEDGDDLPPSGIPYGGVNLSPNPSFEAETTNVVVRENVLQNPSGEFSSGMAAVRVNHIPNPGMDQAAEDVEVRTNLVINPRMSNDGDETVYRVNLAANPSFEVNLDHWNNTGGEVIKRIAKTATGWPLSGRFSLQTTSSGAGNQVVAGGPYKVDAGSTYALSAYVLNGESTARNFQVKVQWRTKKGALLSSDSGALLSVAAGGIGRPFVVAAAPATATQAIIRLVYDAGAAGRNAWWDRVLFEGSDSVQEYFDGSSDEDDGYRHKWAAETGVSRSQRYSVNPKGWKSDRRLLTTTAVKMVGRQAARVVCLSATAAGTLLFAQTIKRGSAVKPKSLAAGKIHAMLEPGNAGQAVVFRLACYDSGGTYLGPLKDPTTGVNIADTVATLETGAWTAIEYGGKVQNKTVVVCVEVRASGALWGTGDSLYLDAALIEPDTTDAGDYFDGATPQSALYGYKWIGDPHWSKSKCMAETTLGWAVSGGTQEVVADGYLGGNCLRATCTDPGGSILILSGTEDVTGGRDHTFSAYVRPDADVDFRVQAQVSGVTVVGSTVTALADEWTRAEVTTYVDEEGADGVIVGVQSDDAAGKRLDVDAALFEATSSLREYFDGDSGDDFQWSGDPSSSSSAEVRDLVDGWGPWGTADPTIWRSDERASHRSFAVAARANYDGELGLTSGRDNVVAGMSYTFGADVSLDVSRTVRFGLRWARGDGTPISESATTLDVVAGTAFHRGAVTATPPAGAAVVSPYAAVEDALADELLYLDAAVFGFGTDSDYQDGDSVDWEWTGDPDYSESHEIATSIDAWQGTNLNTDRVDTWNSEGSYAGAIEADDSVGPHYLTGYADSVSARPLSRYFPNNPSRAITFAVDIRGREAGQARLVLIPFVWDGWNMTPSTDVPVIGVKATVGADSTIRPKITGQFNGPTTHFLVRIEFFGTSGGPMTVGDGMLVDRAVIGFGSWDGSYFDGDSEGASWDETVSRYYGNARVADVEVRDAIDFTSIGSGTSARFAVRLKAPDPFFRDQVSRNFTLAVGRSGVVYSLYELAGGTARINDSVVRIYGPVENPKLTDLESGAWVKISRNIGANGWVEIDSDDWSVVSKSGKSLISDVKHGGASVFLPLTPANDDIAPRLKLEASSVGDGAQIEITARRKFYLA